MVGRKVPVTKSAEAGTIVAIEEDGFVVATGNETVLKLQNCNLLVKAYELFAILRGTKPEIGTKLGENA